MRVDLDDGRSVALGPYEPSPEDALRRYDLSVAAASDDDGSDGETAVSVSVETLTELMAKVGGAAWDVATQRAVAEGHAGMDPRWPLRRWFDRVREEDGMVDTFRHCYPQARGR